MNSSLASPRRCTSSAPSRTSLLLCPGFCTYALCLHITVRILWHWYSVWPRQPPPSPLAVQRPSHPESDRFSLFRSHLCVTVWPQLATDVSPPVYATKMNCILNLTSTCAVFNQQRHTVMGVQLCLLLFAHEGHAHSSICLGPRLVSYLQPAEVPNKGHEVRPLVQ